MAWVSETYCVSGPAVASVPAWAAGQAVFSWREIPGSAISNLAPGMSPPNGGTGATARIDAWCGLAAVGTKLYRPWGGGHDDYYGNEVDAIEFNTANPVWVHAEASTPSGGESNAPYYPDLKPAARHNYKQLQVVPQRNWIISAGTDGYTHSGSSADCAVFDLASQTSQLANTMQSMPLTPSADDWLAFADPATGNVFIWENFSTYKWTQATNTWSLINNSSLTYGFSAMAAVDTTRNRAFVHSCPTPTHPVRYDFATDTETAITLGGPNATVFDSGGYHAAVYDSTSDMIYGRPSGATAGACYTIHPTTWAITALTTTGGGSVPTDANGIHNRWQLIKFGTQAFILYLANGTDNFWALRVA